MLYRLINNQDNIYNTLQCIRICGYKIMIIYNTMNTVLNLLLQL